MAVEEKDLSKKTRDSFNRGDIQADIENSSGADCRENARMYGRDLVVKTERGFLMKVLERFWSHCGILIILLWALFFADVLTIYDSVHDLNVGGWVFVFTSTFLWTGLLMVPALLFGRHARYFYVSFCAISSIICAVQWCARLNFSMVLDGDIVGIILSSSSAEIKTFFKEFATFRFCVILVAFLGGGFVLMRLLSRYKYMEASWGSRFVALILVIGFVCWRPNVFVKPLATLTAGRPMFNLWYDTYLQKDYYKKLQQLLDHPIIPEGLHLRSHGDSNPVIVFVLGESATRNRWSLYGYDKPTTPCMDEIRNELVVFSDFIAAAPNTAAAMRLLLTESTLEPSSKMNCTLATLCRAAGYRCVLLSAQGRWGSLAGFETYVFSGCEKKKFMGEEGLSHPWYDDVLLRYLDAEIASREKDRPTIVFLHLRGSHSPAHLHYPASFAPFPPENRTLSGGSNPLKNSNHYDNTIAFTDALLGSVVKRLKEVDVPSLMFYLSDHGESVQSAHWRDISDPNVWELPMICWFSSAFRAANPDVVLEMESAKDRPLQMDRLLPGLVSLFLIDGYGLAEEDFHHASWMPKDRFIRGKERYVRCSK